MTDAISARLAVEAARILLVDDDPDLLEGLAAWLEASDYHVWTATSGREALALLRQTRVEVVVTDLKMPGIDGLSLLGLIKELAPELEVIFLTGQGSMDDAILALREGRAFDFLKKPLEDPQLVNVAIERALVRRHRLAQELALPSPPDPRLETLNDREREILGLILRGMPHRAIADRVGLTEKTVRNYLSQVYEKLGVSNLPQAILYCLKGGFKGA